MYNDPKICKFWKYSKKKSNNEKNPVDELTLNAQIVWKMSL